MVKARATRQGKLPPNERVVQKWYDVEDKSCCVGSV